MNILVIATAYFIFIHVVGNLLFTGGKELIKLIFCHNEHNEKGVQSEKSRHLRLLLHRLLSWALRRFIRDTGTSHGAPLVGHLSWRESGYFSLSSEMHMLMPKGVRAFSIISLSIVLFRLTTSIYIFIKFIFSIYLSSLMYLFSPM